MALAWSGEDLDILFAAYTGGLSGQEICTLLPHRTAESIRNKACRAGLAEPKPERPEPDIKGRTREQDAAFQAALQDAIERGLEILPIAVPDTSPIIPKRMYGSPLQSSCGSAAAMCAEA